MKCARGDAAEDVEDESYDSALEVACLCCGLSAIDPRIRDFACTSHASQ